MSAPDTTALDGMRRRVLGGAAWAGGSQVVMQVLRMVVAVTLARILAPEDYGLAAIAVVFSGLVLVFSDLAIGAAIVQRKELTEDDRCSAFWLAISAGILFTGLGLALAGPIAGFYGQPEVAPLCTVLSFTFVITSLATTHEALLVRAMDFRSLERRMMLATLVGAVGAIAVAMLTRNAWAIVAQHVIEAIVSSALLWALSPWRPTFRFSWASAHSLAAFSIYLVGHRLLFYAHRNVDNILIGRFVGPAALGAYALAYNIMLFPFARIAGPIQKVVAPAFARMQDEPERIAQAWVRVVRMVGTVSIPALCGLVVVAPDFVHLVLGDKWAPAIVLIQILAWVGLVQSLQSMSPDILQARGQTRTIFRYSIGFTVVHTIGFVIGLRWGVVGVAVSYAITTTLVEPVLTVLTARSIHTSPWRVVAGVRGVFAAALVMACAVAGTRLACLELSVPLFPRFGLCLLVGAVSYAAVYPVLARDGWAELRGIAAAVASRSRDDKAGPRPSASPAGTGTTPRPSVKSSHPEHA